MKHAKKKTTKKKRASQPSEAPKKTVVDPRNDDVKEEKRKKKEIAIHALSEAFSSTASLDDAVTASGDLDKAAEILALDFSESFDAFFTSSVSGEASCSGSSGSGSSQTSCVENLIMSERDCRRSKQKCVVAATGTVSTVLGRSYMVPSPRKTKLNGFRNGLEDRGKAEQFLCSMLGDESELNLPVVRDVFCQCGYDVDKALDVLLDLSSSLDGQSTEETNFRPSHKDDIRFHIELCETEILTDRVSDCSSHSSECELHDSIWSVGCSCRKNNAEVLASSECHSPKGRTTSSHLSQEVLESFFNISKSSMYNPNTMNWKDVVSKLQSLGPEFDVCPTSHSGAQQATYAKGDEYWAFRKTANQQWDSVRSCYGKAATAYSKGAREYASYLSSQGQVKTKLAREADERASKDIFKARNKDIQNVITIDLHGQHVKQAMRMLKMHLLFVSYVQTVQVLRVITGCGAHGMGKSKVKQSVVKLLENEDVKWTEENRGTVLIKLCGQREFSFLDSGIDAE